MTNNMLNRVIIVTLITVNVMNEKVICGTTWKTAIDNSYATNEWLNHNPRNSSNVILSEP